MKEEIRKNLIIISIAIVIISFVGVYILTVTIFPLNTEPINYKEEWLDELPEVPDDLLLYKRDIITGTLSNICNIEEEYWKNPEFYPGWEKAKNSYYLHHSYSSWGAYGYGTYPADAGVNIKNLKEGEEIEFCTFFKAAFNIETYQGIKLESIENEYFKVEITPNEFLLEPTFPVFKEGWIKKLRIKITAKQDVPEGNYIVGFNVVFPDKETNEEMVWEVLRKDVPKDPEYIERCIESLKNNVYFSDQCESLYINRRKKYVSGGTYSIGRPFYTVKINVE